LVFGLLRVNVISKPLQAVAARGLLAPDFGRLWPCDGFVWLVLCLFVVLERESLEKERLRGDLAAV